MLVVNAYADANADAVTKGGNNAQVQYGPYDPWAVEFA